MNRPRITIIRHRRERPEKCSLTPLEGLAGIEFFVYPTEDPDVGDHVRLGFEGPPLTPADRHRPILILDATWRLVAPMERRYAHVEPRSLPVDPPIRTAYPRVGKLSPDPDGGLASVEALAAALRAIGRDHRPVLTSYRWAHAFLALNAAFFGCDEPSAGASSADSSE